MMKILSIILGILISVASYGATYYVSTTGNNSNPGTISQPWATWQKGFDEAEAGDTVYFRGGVWRPTTSTFQSNITLIDPFNYAGSGARGATGTVENPICFFAYPGETPILDCEDIVISGYYAGGISLHAVHYLHFKGLTVRNIFQQREGMSVQAFSGWMCSNLTLEEMTFNNIGGRGAWLTSTVGVYGTMVDSIGDTWDCSKYACADTIHNIPSDTTRVINCDIYDCVDTISWNPYNYADGVKADVALHGVMIFEGVRVWNACDDGLDLSGPGQKIIDKCWTFDIGSSIPPESYDDIDDGNGFKLGGVRDSIAYPNWYLRNCISANNFRASVHELDYTGYYRNNGRAYNNIFHDNMWGPTGFYNTIKLHRNTQWYNNVSFGHSESARQVFIFYHWYPESHNTWDFTTGDPWYRMTDTVTVSTADFVSLNTELLKAARKSDGSLPETDYGKLVAGSDLIGAGKYVGMSANPPIGVDWDWVYAESPAPEPPSVGTGLYARHGGKYLAYKGFMLRPSGSTPDPDPDPDPDPEPSEGVIIADHTVVDKYTDIPQQWIDSVKTIWISIQGASHAEAYRNGVNRLETINSTYQANGSTYTGPPPAASTSELRVSGTTWGHYDYEDGWRYMHGQSSWYTNNTGRTRMKAHLQYCHDEGYELYADMYGWSWDAQFDNAPGGSYDPVYHVRWAGSTREGPDGNKIWGLDSGDSSLTGNRVCMNTYINTVNEYIQYCEDNNIPTKIIFSTGPVDDNPPYNWNTGERGYQQYLKWEHIRNYVEAQESAYLLDYADILAYNDVGEYADTAWVNNNSQTVRFPVIHPDNLEGGDIGHIGYDGAVRLGKALWWLLARMKGWDGEPEN